MLILLAEDNIDHAELTKTKLEQVKGYKVEIAHDGYECINKAREKQYDIILTDFAMPKMNGLELLEKLKEEGIDVPVVMLTGHGDEKIVVKVMKSGGYDYVIKEPDFSYLDILPFVIEDAKLTHQLKKENVRLTQELMKKNKELQEANLNLRELSITDGLTKIYNYRFFKEALALEYKRSKRYNQALSCIIFDIDDFKKINDVHGHRAGDFILVELVTLIKNNIRESDLFARYGGEEFVILLPDISLKSSIKIAEKVRGLVESYDFVWKKKVLKITISLGVASSEKKGVDSNEALLEEADHNLLKAKRKGKNCVYAEF
jgi:two-component system cell cycle response regulator